MPGNYKRENAMPWNPNAVPKPLPWLVDGFVLQGGITALLGPEKVGKSRFIGWLLAHLLSSQLGGVALNDQTGLPYCGHNGFKKILYLNAEEQSEDVMARINTYAKQLGFEPSDQWPIVCLPAAGMQLHRQIDRNEFEQEFLVGKEFDLIVIDPLRRVHAGDENSNSGMAGFHNDIRRWSQFYKQTWLVVHHSGHFRDNADMERIATWCRGATDLPAILDGALMMRNLGSTKSVQHRMLKRIGRFAPLEDLVLLDYGDPKGFAVEQ